jgi:L-histidine Nalpha-methyltransferase / hercynylcysteine S-oxide synthase
VESGKIPMNRKIGRVLFMTHEHEALHAEVVLSSIHCLLTSVMTSIFQTLLYMLIQRAGTGTIPPPGFTPPPWDSLSKFWDSTPDPISSTVTLGPTTVSLGHDDLEADDIVAEVIEDHESGWDNEHPKREVHVNKFRIDWRPVTNGQFYDFYKSSEGTVEFPASWVEAAGNIQVTMLRLFLTYLTQCRSGSNALWSSSSEDSSTVASCNDVQ